MSKLKAAVQKISLCKGEIETILALINSTLMGGIWRKRANLAVNFIHLSLSIRKSVASRPESPPPSTSLTPLKMLEQIANLRFHISNLKTLNCTTAAPLNTFFAYI